MTAPSGGTDRYGGERQPLIHVASDLRASAGTATTATLVLTNAASGPRVLSVTALGVDASWLPSPSRSRALAPDESIQVELTFRPAVGTIPAQYPLAVAVQALDPATSQATAPPAIAELVLTVDAPGTIGLRLSPQDASGVFGRRLELLVENSGSQSASVELYSEGAAGLKIDLDRYRLDVPAGQSVPVSGRVSTRARFTGARIRRAYTIEGRAGSAPRRIEGSYTSRAMFGSGAVRGIALLALMAIWITAAVVFIPKLASHVKNEHAVTAAGGAATTSASPSGGSGDSGGGSGSGGSGGGSGSGDSGGGSGGSGSGGSGGGSGSGSGGAATMQLNGAVSGDNPTGVTVAIAPVSPVNAVQSSESGTDSAGDALTTLGFSEDRLVGKVTSDALLVAPTGVGQNRTTRTTADGGWSLPGVTTPGYYELTFTKPGYQTVRYLVDSSSTQASEPLKVSLVPGQGSLTGSVAGPGGPVGGATVTITDGTNTLTTSTATKGDIGAWSVTGLSTPSTYLVTVAKNGLSTESRLVSLPAGGNADVPLTVRTGAVTLHGTIQGRANDGTPSGLGGATITATGAGVTRTATAVTKGDLAGNYILPDLPTGTYTVTLSAAGYQSQTGRITLRAGQSSKERDATLSTATATLTGTIRDRAGVGQVGAGIVLSNPANTYKTTSTSSPAGGFAFDGVEPGTYLLSVELFGYKSVSLSVDVTAGNTTTANPVLDAGSTDLGKGAITGQVIDSRTGKPLTCSGCITVSVVDHRDGETDQTFSSTISGSESYTLPDAQKDPKTALWPGLHSLQISSPGYEDATVNVSVPLGGTTTVPTVALDPAPVLTGTIDNEADSAPVAPSCVWAVRGGTSVAAADLDCVAPDSGTTGGCPAQSSWPQQAICATPLSAGKPAASGAYTLPVPKHGTYEVYVQSADPEFRTAESFAVGKVAQDLPIAQTVRYDVKLHRWGRQTLNLQYPGDSGVLTAVPAGVTVEVLQGGPGTSCATATAATLPTDITQTLDSDNTGRVTVEGLNGTYRFKATYTDPMTHASNTGCVQQAVGRDKSSAANLPLTSPVSNLVGKLAYSLDGRTKPVVGATVSLAGIYGYNGTTPLTATWKLRTDADGCFVVQSGSVVSVPPDSTDCPHLSTDDRSQGSTPVVSVPGRDLLSSLVSITVSAVGFDSYTGQNVTMLDGTVKQFTLQAQPVDFAGAATTVQVDPGPGKQLGTGFDWRTVQVTATPAVGSGGITVSVQADPTTTNQGTMLWQDSTNAQNVVRAGSYALKANLPGYVSAADPSTATATATLTCTPGQVPACQLSRPLKLEKLAGVVITTVDDSNNAVTGAQVVLEDGTSTPPAGTVSGDTTTFAGVRPGNTNLHVHIKAAGYKFIDDTDSGTLDCSGASTIPAPEVGETVSCTASLHKLGSITGIVEGVQALAPASDPVSPIGGATVKAWPCTAHETGTDGVQYCTAENTSTSFTAVAASSTNPAPGSFTLTGSTDAEGLATGWYAVRVTPLLGSGYCAASTTASGTCPADLGDPDALDVAVHVTAGSTTTFNPSLYLRPATLRLNAVFGTLEIAASDLNVTMSGNLDGTGATTTFRATAVSGKAGYNYEFLGTDGELAPIMPGTYTLSYGGDNYVPGTQLVSVGENSTPAKLVVQQTTNAINGAVTADQGDNIGAPLKNAIVCVRSASATGGCGAAKDTAGSDVVLDINGEPLWEKTGADGGYLFDDVLNTPTSGRYYVQIETPGYRTFVSAPFAVKYTGPSSWTQNAYLTRITWPVTATVTIASGDPVDGGTWKFVSVAGGTGAPVYSARVADSITVSGTTATVKANSLPPGCWTLSYSQIDHHGTLSDPGSVTQTDDSLGCASATLVVPTTPPASGAQVTAGYTLKEYQATVAVSAEANGSGLTVPSSVSVTAQDGSITLVDGKSVGVNQSTSTSLGWFDTGTTLTLSADLADPWQLSSGSDTTIDHDDLAASLAYTVPMQTVEVTVRDQGGAPLDGAAVSVTPSDAPDWYTVPGGLTTGGTASGQVALVVPKNSDVTGWTFSASEAGYLASGDCTVDSHGTSVSCKLYKTRSVTVTVEDENGDPMDGATVSVSKPSSGFGWFHVPGDETTPSSAGAGAGTASFTLPYGSGWNVAVTPGDSNYSGSSSGSFTVDDDHPDGGVTVQLERKTATIHVLVTDTDDQPIHNADVVLTDQAGSASATRTGNTSSSGIATFSGIPYGSSWTASASATGYDGNDTTFAVSGSDTTSKPLGAIKLSKTPTP